MIGKLGTSGASSSCRIVLDDGRNRRGSCEIVHLQKNDSKFRFRILLNCRLTWEYGQPCVAGGCICSDPLVQVLVQTESYLLRLPPVILNWLLRKTDQYIASING